MPPEHDGTDPYYERIEAELDAALAAHLAGDESAAERRRREEVRWACEWWPPD